MKTKYFLIGFMMSMLIISCAQKEKGFNQIIAHRGEHIDCPENTLPAIMHAFELGADGVEIDVRVTLDSVVVLCHNQDVMEITGISGIVEEMTYAELRQLDFGFKKQEKWKGTRISSFKEVLENLPKGKFLHVEMKAPASKLLQPMIKDVKDAGIGSDQVMFTSSDINNLIAVEEELPDYLTFWNGYNDPDEAKKAGIDGIAAYFKAEHAKKVLESGLLLRIGLINDIQIANQVKEIGVKIIDTDNPAKMIPILRK